MIKEEVFYPAAARMPFLPTNGVEFMYLNFIYGVYKEDKRAIYAVDPSVKVIETFCEYKSKILGMIQNGYYENFSHFLFCGDSHIMGYEYLVRHRRLGPAMSLICRIQGASAYGLGNVNSESGAIRQIKRVLSEPVGNPLLLLNLGEVDCRYTLWLLEKQKKVPLEESLRVALENYEGLVDWFLDRGYKRIVLAGPHIPVWSDETIWTKNQTGCRKVYDATLKFSGGLRHLAQRKGLKYFDINEDLQALDGEGRLCYGVIPGEHHLNPEFCANFYISKILEAYRQTTTY